jgi:transcriptional regulator with XRE-family HTH domain
MILSTSSDASDSAHANGLPRRLCIHWHLPFQRRSLPYTFSTTEESAKIEAIVDSPEMKLPEVMRRRRTELSMSQAALAKAVGVDVRQIRRYEAGDHQPAFSVAVNIADVLGISLTSWPGRSSTVLISPATGKPAGSRREKASRTFGYSRCVYASAAS